MVQNLFKMLSVGPPQPPGDWRCGCCSARPVLGLSSPPVSAVSLALLSYNMAAVYLQQGDAASPYSSQTSGSHHTGEVTNITARHKLASKQTFSGEQTKYSANSQPPSWSVADAADERNEFHDLLSGVLKSGHQPG